MKKIFFTVFSLVFGNGAFSQTKPNVIFIMADDIGYQDFGCYGAEKIKTPNLDRLASDGVRFANAYSPASTSSPSRYSLLTGEYAWRKNVGILPADAPLSIDTTRNTLPKMMRSLGYCTGLVGKWHLGLGKVGKPVDFNTNIDAGPEAVGFDYCYYFPGTNDRVPCVFVENNRVVNLDLDDPIRVSYKNKIGNWPTGRENPELLKLKYNWGHDQTIINGISRIGWMCGGKSALWDDETMGEVLCSKAVDFIKNNREHPFFLYYAPHNAHEPRVPSPKFRGKSEAGIYGDVIEEFDYYVGRIIETLKDEGLYENTVLIVTSDNGPMIKEGYVDGGLENINGHNPYAELRGEKYSLHEGGNKVPFICTWLGKIKRPFVQKQPFIYLDMLATLPVLTGCDKSFSSDVADSKDASLLFLDPDAPKYRDYILTQNNSGEWAFRMDNWKFIPAGKGHGAELYNLDADPSELHNVFYAYPEIVTAFRKYLSTIKK